MQEYGITAVDYLTRAVQLRQGHSIDGEVCRFVYAALELRCCIERTLFEYLVLVKLTDLPSTMEKLYRAKDLKKTLLKADPDFLRKLDYVNLLLEAGEVPARVTIPDLDKLASLYGQINAYVHAPKRPGKTADDVNWWTQLQALECEAEECLKTILSRPVGRINLNELGWANFEAWKCGGKTDAQVIEEFRGQVRNMESADPG